MKEQLNVLVNFSNHPSSNWSDGQRKAAENYGAISDLPFPTVPPEAGETEIEKMGEEYVRCILSLNPRAVMCQGEFTMTFYVVNRLMDEGITCVSACSERTVEEIVLPDKTTEKRSVFRFVGFRAYIR